MGVKLGGYDPVVVAGLNTSPLDSLDDLPPDTHLVYL